MIYAVIALLVIGVLSFLFTRLIDLASVATVIWLAFLGQWWALIRAGIVLLVGSIIFPLLSLPVGLLMLGIFHLFKPKSKILLLILAFFSHTLNLILMILINVGILYLFTTYATERTWIPLVILSYSLGAGIWGNLVYEEMQNDPESYGQNLAFFADLSFLAISIVAIVKRPSFLHLVQLYKMLVIIYLPIMMIRLYVTVK